MTFTPHKVSRNYDFLQKKIKREIPKEYSILKIRCPYCRHKKASMRDTRDKFRCCKCGKYFNREGNA